MQFHHFVEVFMCFEIARVSHIPVLFWSLVHKLHTGCRNPHDVSEISISSS